jgi:hypothetical protein
MMCVAILGMLTVGLFQARGWFGVRPREGWRTVLREGWWALAITLVLELGALLVWMLPRRA